MSKFSLHAKQSWNNTIVVPSNGLTLIKCIVTESDINDVSSKDSTVRGSRRDDVAQGGAVLCASRCLNRPRPAVNKSASRSADAGRSDAAGGGGSGARSGHQQALSHSFCSKSSASQATNSVGSRGWTRIYQLYPACSVWFVWLSHNAWFLRVNGKDVKLAQ